jgi:hypothetical protein
MISPTAHLANIAFANESWAWVALLFGAGAILVLVLTYRNSPLRGGAKVAAMALKAVGLILLALALMEPVHLDETPKKHANDVAILADNSAGLAVPLGEGKEAPGRRLARRPRRSRARSATRVDHRHRRHLPRPALPR